MRILAIALIFLLTSSPVLAANITVGNLTIMVPKITIRINELPEMNETPRIDIMKLMERTGVSKIIDRQMELVYKTLNDAIKISIDKSLEKIPELVRVMLSNQSSIHV
ncbi:MAG: hypothetical protein JW700_03235 [Candidatus Aenigmarchaeota archaeon]|nr:hypothetical protein [Candidatus Aenigmarchaeota archaeon]